MHKSTRNVPVRRHLRASLMLEQQLMLERIFPDGVCDFGQPDAGLPPGW
jgi:hypothetical protein